MRLRIWSWMQGVSIVLGFWLSPWFWNILAIQLYVVLALMRDVWFATFIRKWFYRLIFKHELRKMISDKGGPIAYPLLLEIEFNPDIEKKYIDVGHDKFVKWMMDFSQDKADKLVKAVHGILELDEEPPVDPETTALMKEAMSQEYQQIARDANRREFQERYDAYNQEKLLKEAQQILGTDKDLDEQL